MARGRMLNNKISASKQFNLLSTDTCRLLATWTIAHLDMRGVFYGDPAIVKSYVFPRRADVTIEDVERYLQIMANTKDGDGVPLIILFEARGELWQYWPQFAANQVGLRADRESSDFPCPPDSDKHDEANSQYDAGRLPEDCRKTAGDTPAEEKLSEGNNDNDTREPELPIPPDEPPPPWVPEPEQDPEDRSRSEALATWLNARNGVIGPIEADQLFALVDDCEAHRQALPRASPGAGVSGDTWVAEAIREAVACNQHQRINVRFVESIARRWMADGYKAAFAQGASHEKRTRRGKGDGRGAGSDIVILPTGKPPTAALVEEFHSDDELRTLHAAGQLKPDEIERLVRAGILDPPRAG